MQNILKNSMYLKRYYMPEMKLKQLHHEKNTWKRLLEFMMEENIHQKNRVAEILQDRFDKNLLEEVDHFQTRFIRQDDLIRILRDEVNEMEKLIAPEISTDGKIIKEIDQRWKRLRNHMKTAEKQFGELRTAFNHFLSENIL